MKSRTSVSLAGMTQLTKLFLTDNAISDVAPLAELTQLTWLFLGNNKISDVAPLVDLVNLEFLQLSGNPITDTTPLWTLLEKNPNVQTDVDVRPPTDDLDVGIDIQDYTTWDSLPEGVKARLGKGEVEDVAYSPDGKYLAVASSIGIWLYDAETYQALSLLYRAHRYY